MDPYLVLGVPRNCTHQQVKQTFRARVRREHPDRGGDEQKFIRICTAYKQLLAEPDRAVDLEASEQAANQNLVDLLQSVSARSVAGTSRSRPVRSGDARRKMQADSGAAIGGAIALTILIAEVLVDLLNVKDPPPVPAATTPVEDVVRPTMTRAENERRESQQKLARTTAGPGPGRPSQPPHSEAGRLLAFPIRADLDLTPAGLSNYRDD